MRPVRRQNQQKRQEREKEERKRRERKWKWMTAIRGILGRFPARVQERAAVALHRPGCGGAANCGSRVTCIAIYQDYFSGVSDAWSIFYMASFSMIDMRLSLVLIPACLLENLRSKYRVLHSAIWSEDNSQPHSVRLV